MRGLVSYLLGGILVVFTMDFVAPPAEFGITAWPSAAAQSAFPRQAITADVVDRSHKGDRLPAPASVSGTPLSATLRPARRMIVGCDPVFSPLSVSARLNYPGWCVAGGGPEPELLRVKRVG
jgi:hypothetical protein